MFDLGWQEFLLVAIIAVIVVGPKDLPRVVRSVSQWVRKARSMAREFQSSLEEVAREAELDDVRREVQSISKDGIGKSLEKQFDPDGSMRQGVEDARKSVGAEEIEADLKSVQQTAAPASEPASTPAPASSASATPAIETAEDYAAKSVTPSSPATSDSSSATGSSTTGAATEPAIGSTTVSDKPRAAAGSAASGEG